MQKAANMNVPARDTDKKTPGAPEKTAARQTALLLEDDDFHAAITQELVEKCSDRAFSVQRVRVLSDARRLLARTDFGVALVDMEVPDSRGLDTLREILRANPTVPVIVLAGQDDIAAATGALSMGAQEFLPKSLLDSRTLERAICYAIERKKTESRLTVKAYADSLTGLGNRTQLYERWRRLLFRCIRDARSAGVLVADIDGFQLITDRYGDHAGTLVLKDFAAKLQAELSQVDIAARLCRDDFIVILESVRCEGDVKAMKSKLARLSPLTMDAAGQTLTYTVSFGATLVDPDTDDDLLGVVQRADADMNEGRLHALKDVLTV